MRDIVEEHRIGTVIRNGAEWNWRTIHDGNCFLLINGWKEGGGTKIPMWSGLTAEEEAWKRFPRMPEMYLEQHWSGYGTKRISD
jgi:hypothetical protein